MAGPGTSTWMPAYFAINAYSTRSNLGYASAAAVIMLLITVGDLPAAGAAHRLAGAPARGGRRMSAALAYETSPRPRAPARRASIRAGSRRIRGASIAILVFLAMCAAFVSIPLYVVIVTSFKTMDQIALGEIFSLPTTWTLEALVEGVGRGLLGHDAARASSDGFFNSLAILFPSLFLSIALSSVTGYALALWNVRWAGTFLFVLFMCAFVPFQIIMIPLVVLTASIGIYGTHLGDRHRPRRAGDAAADADLPQFLQGHAARDHQRRDHGFRLLLAHLRRDHPADVRQHHDRRADPA